MASAGSLSGGMLGVLLGGELGGHLYRIEGDEQPPSAFDGRRDHEVEIVRYTLRLVEVNGEPADDEERHIRLGEGFHEALVRVVLGQRLRHGRQYGTGRAPVRGFYAARPRRTTAEKPDRVTYRVTWTRFLAVSSPLVRSRHRVKRRAGTGWHCGGRRFDPGMLHHPDT